MVATITTKNIKDGDGNIFAQQVLDVSGVGDGPFIPLSIISATSGSTYIDLQDLLVDLLTQIVLGSGTNVIGRVGLQIASADVSGTNPVPVAGGQLTTVTAAITSGQSLSAAADLGTGRLVGLIIPASWTSAQLSFQGSTDGTNFFDLYDDATERSIASGSVVASRFLALNFQDWLMVRSLKVRSGSASVPVNQGAGRSITLVLA